MSLLDALIILLLFCSIYFSYYRGAILQIFSFVFGLVGLSIGVRLSLILGKSFHPSTKIKILEIVISLAFGVGFFVLGEFLGNRLRIKTLGTKLQKPDRYLGIFVGLIGGIIFICFGASYVLNNSSVNAQNAVLESRILAFINEHTIAGIKISNAFFLIDPNHTVPFQGTTKLTVHSPGTSTTAYDLPTQGPFANAIRKVNNSVVLIEWSGCGELHYGSGYVAHNHVVVTAAHVVAGAGLIKISDRNHSYVGTVTLYDTKKDLAVIYVPDLPDTALKINTDLQPIGTQTTLLGYKEGGPLTDGVGPIIKYDTFSNLQVTVSADVNIGGNTPFYQVLAPSNHGDSGGPLILSDGSVLGHLSFIYFQNSTDDQSFSGDADGNLSYFVSASSYASEVNNVKNSQIRASTGSCLN